MKVLRRSGMYKIALVLITSLLCACSTVRGDQPFLGMRFKQPYPAFAGGGEHDGLDIDVSLGTQVRSPADGVVILSTVYDIRGNKTNVVMIRHNNGYMTRYLHIDNVRVKRGDEVKKGQPVAVTALNGPGGPNTNRPVPYPHLHLEVIKDSKLVDPMSLGMSCNGTGWIWPVGC